MAYKLITEKSALLAFVLAFCLGPIGNGYSSGIGSFILWGIAWIVGALTLYAIPIVWLIGIVAAIRACGHHNRLVKAQDYRAMSEGMNSIQRCQ